MRALQPEVIEAVWAAAEPVLPVRPVDTHPLGCHRRRVSDRLCFEAMLYRLVTGCSWVDAEQLMGRRVSDTTLRARRDEWIAAGVFDKLAEEALSAYDRIIGLDLSDVALDGSQHKAPCGGEGTGPNHTDRAKLGWKWSILIDRHGIPIGWTADAANRQDYWLLEPTLQAADQRGLLIDIETLHVDRGYDNRIVRDCCRDMGIDDVVGPKRVRKYQRGRRPRHKVPMGYRWPVERTNSWLSNFGQLRRSTDRRTIHRLAQLSFATTLLIVAKLIDWRNRWQS
jgi:transposase